MKASTTRRNEMNSEYLTDEEYEKYWFELEGVRKDISESIGIKPRMEILDVCTGSGFFAVELAKQLQNGKIAGIDVVEVGLERAKKLALASRVSDVVSISKMDATDLSFPDSHFDLVTTFLGIRDIYMAKGKKGVRKALEEMIRVLKLRGKLIICITPPEDMETEDQKIAVEVEGEIFGAKSLSKKFYLDLFRKHNLSLRETRAYYTHKKLTPEQTRTEIRDGIEIAERIYDRKGPSFNKIWGKYGRRIETVGYGMYSKIVMLVAKKLT